MLFAELPAEIIQSIVSFLPPDSLVNFCQTSKRLNQIADTPIIWRYHCRTQFQFWDPWHSMPRNFKRPANDSDWKSFFRLKMRYSQRIDIAMNELVNTSYNKIKVIERMLAPASEEEQAWIGEYTYDVKDALLRHCHASEEDEDYLAKRFWATAVLEKLHRALAIKEWITLSRSPGDDTNDLERSLGAFDLFVSDNEYDLADISNRLDILASELRKEHPNFDQLTTRNKALTVAYFLRTQGFNGASEGDYHNLPNNFIGIALRDPNHQAIPLICAAIYCFLARRVGLVASPCAFPMHVYAMVFPQNGDLDGKPRDSSMSADVMYIDAFREETIDVPISHLRSQLRAMGAGALEDDEFLSQASNQAMVVRSSRNIMHSVQIMQMQVQNPADADQRPPLWFSQTPDMDNAFYASLWSTMLLQGPSSPQASRRQRYLPFLCEHIQAHCPWDADLLEKFVAPLFSRYPNERHQTAQFAQYMREKDERPPKPLSRNPQIDAKVDYKVGQVFKHQRYGYEGVIVGWDAMCGATDAWIDQMGVDNLQGGRNQSFYHVLVDEKSTRYVAQENIHPIDDKPSPALIRLAGRYFRRWDPEIKRFVSNIKAEYPDD